MELSEVIKLAIKVLNKSMDSTSLTSEKLELATVSREDGKLKYKMLDRSAVCLSFSLSLSVRSCAVSVSVV
eukprot:102273-Rhodomonas_salina.1